MAERNVGWTRDEAIHYLASSANYKALRETATGRIAGLGDMSTQTLKRHAAFMFSQEKAGRWVRNYRELAGHPISERHAGRVEGGLVRNRAPDYVAPLRKPRGEFSLGGVKGTPGGSFVRITSGQTIAVRSLAKAAGRKARGSSRGGKYKVTVNVTGGLPGQFAHLFDKGGWDAEKLLEAAGYRRRPGSGRYWDLQLGKPGLERFLLDYVASMGNYGQRWGAVKLYEIWAWSEPFGTSGEQVTIPAESLRRIE